MVWMLQEQALGSSYARKGMGGRNSPKTRSKNRWEFVLQQQPAAASAAKSNSQAHLCSEDEGMIL